jgi:hypothetical protein
MQFEITLFRPFLKAKFFTINFYDMITTTISRLCFSVCPTAIGRRIITISIDSIKTQSFWRFAHIFEKVFKGFPAFAKSYSSAAITMIFVILGIFTANTHTLPNREGASMCQSVCGISFNKNISRKTSATANKASFQMSSADFLEIATITSAKPHSICSLETTLG